MVKKLVGRLREQVILTDALNSHRSELIAVYGRRRIGKTYLIRTFFEKKSHIVLQD
jgi:AAA+ ATPase superfamily predicted ATPase